jgi:hypothetical protein
VRVEPHANLTITLIRRNNFGPLRLVSSPRDPGSLLLQSLRAKKTPPVCRASDSWKPQPFPYDTPVPGVEPFTGLARVYEKTRAQHRGEPKTLPHIADGKGKLLDVFA